MPENLGIFPVTIAMPLKHQEVCSDLYCFPILYIYLDNSKAPLAKLGYVFTIICVLGGKNQVLKMRLLICLTLVNPLLSCISHNSLSTTV